MSDRRIIATFIPEAWINDNAVEIDERKEFDVTDVILKMGELQALALRDDRHETDQLAITQGVVGEHTGLFRVEVELAIQQYYLESVDQP